MTMRRHATYSFFVCLYLACCVLSADVIVFPDGSREEGHVTREGAHLRVRLRGSGDEYTISTTRVAAVLYDVWLDDVYAEEMTVRDIFVSRDEEKSPHVSHVTTGFLRQEKTLYQTVWDWVKNQFASRSPFMLFILLAWLLTSVVWLVAFVTWIALIADAFHKNALWGGFCLFLPPLSFIYIFMRYRGNKKDVFIRMYAPLIWIASGYVIFQYI